MLRVGALSLGLQTSPRIQRPRSPISLLIRANWSSLEPVIIVTLIGTCITITHNATGFIAGLNALKDRCGNVGHEANGLVAQPGAVRAATN